MIFCHGSAILTDIQYTYDTKVYSIERLPNDTIQDGCTVNLTVRYIAKKWTLLILLELYKGEGHTRRFSELKNCLVGITQKVLSSRLKELEKRRAHREQSGRLLFSSEERVHPDVKRPRDHQHNQGYEAMGFKMENHQHRLQLPGLRRVCAVRRYQDDIN